MDRQALLGYILIFILLLAWMWMSAPPPAPQQAKQATESRITDTVKTTVVKPPRVAPDSLGRHAPDPFGKFFASRAIGRERYITIETDIYRAVLSSKGGVIKEWELKKYKTWDGQPVQLVDFDKVGDFSLLFTTTDGRLINTHNLYFDLQSPQPQLQTLSGDEETKVDFVLPASNGGRLIKTLSFKNREYGFHAELKFLRLGEVIANYEYQVMWESGLRYQEQNSIDESGFADANIYAGKELTQVDASQFDEPVKKDITGSVDWVATRNKYFALAIVPQQGSSEGAFVEGSRRHMPDNGAIESYNIAVKMPFKGSTEEVSAFRVFFGPLDLEMLKSYDNGLEQIMSLGWAWIIRPISEYIMLPLMNFLHWIIPNWGIVIIVFSLIIKVALHPLTKSSMKSMKKMQTLQPMMNEIREKYKDEPQKMNQQMMGLYKDYGVNPAGGCLPLLLQLPILYALFNVFRASIELRQADFFWWINDLSIPDKIVTLPFEIPIFGIREVSGLALFMGITMFIQQKMTVKDPRQKMMVWLMPLLMTLLFNSFPSGLNLYYFVFNLLSIGQQFLINKQHGDEPLRKVEPKKRGRGGIFSRLPSNLTKLKR